MRYKNYVFMQCETCGEVYRTPLIKGVPKGKRFCGSQCVYAAMRSNASGTHFTPSKEGAMARSDALVPIHWESHRDKQKAFERYREAFEEAVEGEDLASRFGMWAATWMDKMSKESRQKRKAKRNAMRSTNTGKTPDDAQFKRGPGIEVSSRQEKNQEGFIPLTNGLLWGD